MKNLFKKLSTFLSTMVLSFSAMVLTSCAPKYDDGLELVYFGEPLPESQPLAENRHMNSPLRAQDTPLHWYADDVTPEASVEEEDNTLNVTYYDYDGGVTLEAYVKNRNNLKFDNVVVYSAGTGMEYIFSRGDSQDIIAKETRWDGEVTTKLHFNLIGWDKIIQEDAINSNNSCQFEASLEIRELNFVGLTGEVGTNMAENNIRQLNIVATEADYSRKHQWSDWEHVSATCEEYAGMKRHCLNCGIEEFRQYTESELSEYGIDPDTIAPTGHVYSGEWDIIQKNPTILEGSDLLQSRGECSVCHHVISQELANLRYLNDFSLELEVPSGTKSIRQGTFIDCEYLTSVRFPSSVEEIQHQAFNYPGCDNFNITDVYFMSAIPPRFEGDIFGCGVKPESGLLSDFRIHIPNGSREAYAHADNDNTSRIWEDYCVPCLVDDIVVSE